MYIASAIDEVNTLLEWQWFHVLLILGNHMRAPYSNNLVVAYYYSQIITLCEAVMPRLGVVLGLKCMCSVVLTTLVPNCVWIQEFEFDC